MSAYMSVRLQTVTHRLDMIHSQTYVKSCLCVPCFRNIGPCSRCGAVTQTGSCSTPPTSVSMLSQPSRHSPETSRAKAYVPPHLRQRLAPSTPPPSHSPSSSLHARWYVCTCVGARMLQLTVLRALARHSVQLLYCGCGAASCPSHTAQC